MTQHSDPLRILRSANLLLVLLVACGMLAGGSRLSCQQLKTYLSADSSQWAMLNTWVQPWLRYNQSNPGSLVQGVPSDETVDIGIRRARVVITSQVTDRAFMYLQFGMNNFNSMVGGGTGNRKAQIFIHDFLGEYRLSTHNEVKMGMGLTITNGPSRFSMISAATIMTTDVPSLAEATIDQTDLLSRKLAIYARGQIGPIDYRVSLCDPFPITSNGSVPPPISANATFAQKGHSLQPQAYVIWQFADHEPHTTPNLAGTYLGKRRVFNVAAGVISQSRATWRTVAGAGGTVDTVFDDMLLRMP